MTDPPRVLAALEQYESALQDGLRAAVAADHHPALATLPAIVSALERLRELTRRAAR